MTDQPRIEWLFDAIRTQQSQDGNLPKRICLACVAELPVDGAELSLMSDGGTRARVGASNGSAASVAELEITVGEGPGVDAYSLGAPVLVSDIAGDDRTAWPAFADGLAAIGTRAVFAFPLQLGVVKFGILTLTRGSPGPLTADALAKALRVSDVTTLLLLGTDGELVDDFDEHWLEETTWTRAVHQATGMIMSQLDVGAEDAFVRLRGHAFGHGMTLSEAADRVVTRRLTFSQEDE